MVGEKEAMPFWKRRTRNPAP